MLRSVTQLARKHPSQKHARPSYFRSDSQPAGRELFVSVFAARVQAGGGEKNAQVPPVKRLRGFSTLELPGAHRHALFILLARRDPPARLFASLGIKPRHKYYACSQVRPVPHFFTERLNTHESAPRCRVAFRRSARYRMHGARFNGNKATWRRSAAVCCRFRQANFVTAMD